MGLHFLITEEFEKAIGREPRPFEGSVEVESLVGSEGGENFLQSSLRREEEDEEEEEDIKTNLPNTDTEG